MIEQESKEEKKIEKRNPWSWIPSLYFAEGLPYVIVTFVATVMYKQLGISNAEIALYTSWLYLPWVIKPLWSPVVDLLKTKRFWIYTMQLIIGGGIAGVALTIPLPSFFQFTLAFFWLLAFSSATHDIAADGFYMLALSESQQSFFVGIRSTFYRIAMITGQGLLVILAGFLETRFTIQLAWIFTLGVVGILFVLFFIYHRFILPHPKDDKHAEYSHDQSLFTEFFKTFLRFFEKKKILLIILFMLFYRLGESQIVKMAPLFLLDKRDVGGLGLNLTDIGFLYGTVGIIALMLGGILGGLAVSKKGLKFWLWPMMFAINIPHLLYVYLAFAQPTNYWIINACVAGEQFSYGFGFTAFLVYMMYVSDGEFKASHYAICTGFMALGMMVPGMFSGMIQEALGYKTFFIYVVLTIIPSLFILKFIPLEYSYGKKKNTES